MASIIICFLIVSEVLCGDFNTFEEMADQQKATRFFINQEAVTEAQFSKKLASLEEAGDWYCRDTSDGGVTGRNYKDAQGKEYRYECSFSQTTGTTCSLTDKEMDRLKLKL